MNQEMKERLDGLVHINLHQSIDKSVQKLKEEGLMPSEIHEYIKNIIAEAITKKK